MGVHGLFQDNQSSDKIIGGKVKQTQSKKVKAVNYQLNNVEATSRPNLAQRLKCQTGQKTHPSSMIYIESVKQIQGRVRVQKE